MNIGFLYGQRVYPPGTGGSVHGYHLAKGLAERGHGLYSWYYGQDDNPYVTHFRGRQLGAFLGRVDVLYVRVGWESKHTWRWLRRLRLGRLPVVWELNALPGELRYLGAGDAEIARTTARLRRAARSVDAAIGVTEGVRRYLKEEIGISDSHCVPNGSDPDLFRPAQGPHLSEAPLRVAWIGGTKWPWHDLDSVLEAATILAERGAGVRFCIYGDPTNLPGDLPPNVHACGVVAYEKMGRHLGSADVGVFLLAPLPDGQVKDASPLKLFDYMASGLAVIAQNAGQTGEVIGQREAGLLTTGTPQDLAEKIVILERDRDLCRQLGFNGRKAILEYYNWARVAKETEAALQDIVGAGR